jgi:putative ABC transport system substrate-binding protein
MRPAIKFCAGQDSGDIPVKLPTEFELVINLKTAKALGEMIPDRLLTLAHELMSRRG